MRHRSLGRLAGALAALALTFLPSALSGQQVTGRFLDAVDGQPLAGAYIVLLRGGVQVASTVTRVDGGFRLIGPAPGSYTLRADQLGYRVVEREVELPPPGEPLRVELTASQQAIELEGLTAEVDQRCEVPRLVAAQVAELWEEVGEAFQVAALLEERQLYDLRIASWERELEPGTLRVQEETRSEGRGIQRGSPFKSLPPEDLAEGGYLRENRDGTFSYYAPDAQVLLSSSFQETHCFGLTLDPPSDGEDDWVGIRFEPRRTDRPDIRGALWIDQATLQPRRLDFRYTELPGRVGSRDLGGRVVFQRLPEGPWIIREWWIRMPRVVGQRFYTFNSSEPRTSFDIAGIQEVGGQVTQAGPRGGELVTLGETGRVEGSVVDASGQPAAGTRLALEGTVYRTRADASGRFRLDDLPAGRYLLVHTSPVLDSLGLEGGGTPVTVEAGEPTRVDVRLPSVGTLLAEACTEPIKEGEPGVVRGVVRRADGSPAGGARVRLFWTESIDVRGVGSGVGIRRSNATATLPVDEDGRWMACGLPVETQVTARALPAQGVGVGPAARMELVEGEVTTLTLTAPTAMVVVGEEGDEAPGAAEPAADAAAEEAEDLFLAELANLGVRPEALGRRFAGPERIAERRDASMDAVDLVRVLAMPRVRVTILPPNELCIHSTRNTRMNLAGGPAEPICAAVVIDGIPSDTRQLSSIPGESVAAMAYLRPSEAGARFGTGTDGGALVVWTRRGGR